MTRVLVVGGGIAGTSAAAALAGRADVVLVEREPALAYHTTGRSAALFFENYGAGPVRPLTRASRTFLHDPPPDLVDHPLLSERGALTVGGEDQGGALDAMFDEGLASGADVRRLDGSAACRICPALRPDAITDAVWEPDAADLDVAGLHQAFVRKMRSAGGAVSTDAELVGADRTGGGWRVTLRRPDSTTFEWRGDILLDAAGAWADEVAARCGVAPVGVVPMRRTAFMVAGTGGSTGWPLVAEVDNRFYFKPDGEQILCSLADETPSDPCDAKPEEIDVALAIERINEATTLGIRHVRSSWAGLRTFAPDRSMVIGPEPAEPRFVWLAGQGGTGIQTAEAAGRLAAALALGDPVPGDITAAGSDPDALSPARFRA